MQSSPPIVAMMPTLTGRGYWLIASDGGVFSYGDAEFHGSTGGIKLRESIAKPAATDLGYMPAFKDSLTDGQIAELAAYLRRQFAPDKPAWTGIPAAVGRIRQE